MSFWAKKSWKGETPPTVVEHCGQVRDAAQVAWQCIGADLSDALVLDQKSLEEDLFALYRAASLLHDFAKVNSAFQTMLRSKPGDNERQPVRHEILAAWLLSDPQYLGQWFSSLHGEEQSWPVIWAIAGHHRKMGDPARDCRLFDAGSGTARVEIPLAEIRDILVKSGEAIGASALPPELLNYIFDTIDDDDDGLEQQISKFVERSYNAWNRLRRNPKVVRRTALLKALLIAADVSASALIADKKSPANWVPQELAARITPDLLDPIIKRGTKGKPALRFQETVGESKATATIVIAGCGNGKTTAAYLWAQRHANGRKLWFTYPTTGTASAGYSGYLYGHPDLLSVLMHGRAEVDLLAMRGNGLDESDASEETARLESLQAWGRQAIVCTVDTVLGLLQNQRRPLFSFPAIVAGAFVFDEIHSYDAKLFGSLLRFLTMFPGFPVLLMSASIPPGRLAKLREVLGDRAGDVIRGDEVLEGHQRYRLERRESAAACHQEVTKALGNRQKVLWVCNTVDDAIRTARSAREWAGIPYDRIIVYHSRFRYRDRVNRQARVLEEFAYHRDGLLEGERICSGPALLVATQVCEMSLDISADLMVTAECPLPSLVQRLGRLNRYATADDPWPCLVYPFQGDPYNERPDPTRGDYRAAMAAGREMVRELAGKPCSQKILAERLDKMTDSEEFETHSAWLDDGWLTEPAQLRDGDAGLTLIREDDLVEIERELGPENAKSTKWTAARLVPWTIPMRYRRGFQPVSRLGGYPVSAKGIVTYCEKEGAAWQMSTN